MTIKISNFTIKNQNMKQHTPVMVSEVMQAISDYIDINPSKKLEIFDGTLGHAWHMTEICSRYEDKLSHYVWVDVDQEMFAVANENINNFIISSGIDKEKIIIKNIWYQNIVLLSEQLQIKYDIAFIDLGVNLWHFKLPDRGFSMKDNGSLDMRFDTNNNEIKNADRIVNNYKQDQLEKIMIDRWEFSPKMASKIADQIISYRHKQPIKTTTQLTDLLWQIGIGTKKAAVVFQAIRIEVNQEMANVVKFLSEIQKVLKKDGILIVLTYHSVEDRTVKNYFRYEDNQGIIALTKHAIKPTYQEVKINLPSRSAKMRVYKKL